MNKIDSSTDEYCTGNGWSFVFKIPSNNGKTEFCLIPLSVSYVSYVHPLSRCKSLHFCVVC